MRNLFAFMLFVLSISAFSYGQSKPTLRVDTFPGATLDEKISAALKDVDGPVTLDACHFAGNQEFAAWPFTRDLEGITFITCGFTIVWNPSDFLADLPSHFSWHMFGTILRNSSPGGGGLNGTTSGLLNSRTTGTLGSISAGTNVLRVLSNTNFYPGRLVSIVGAEGGNSLQLTTLQQPLSRNNSLTDVSVNSSKGWGNANNLLLINSEVLECRGVSGNVFKDCERGALGTFSAEHSAGSTVKAIGAMVTSIQAVDGNRIYLDQFASFSVHKTRVRVGSEEISLSGSGILDGNKNPEDLTPAVNLEGFMGILLSNSSIGEGVEFRNLNHAGIMCVACMHNHFFGSFENIGRQSAGIGFDLLLYGKSTYNDVMTSCHHGSHVAFAIDDRTIQFNQFAGSGTDNFANLGTIVTDNGPGVHYGVLIQGGSLNEVHAGQIVAKGSAVYINSLQWSVLPTPQDNYVSATYSEGQAIADNSAKNGNNTIFIQNAQNLVSCSEGNTCRFEHGPSETASVSSCEVPTTQ